MKSSEDFGDINSQSQLSTYRTKEAARVYALSKDLFLPEAYESLLGDKHHLGSGFEAHNIFPGFREEVMEFVKSRRIKWHDGTCDRSIVSSQVACLNCFFRFINDPVALGGWLSKLYPDLKEVLPISSSAERALPDGSQPFVTFEWIGQRNYLNELRWGSRGQNCTSVDVVFRFRTIDGKIHIVIVEWKYCEDYHKAQYERISINGTDRVSIYRPHLELDGCQLALGGTTFEDFFFSPLYQMMRLQLLASAMEREREMDADIVSVLHIVPRANDGLLNAELSQNIAPGKTVGDVWSNVTIPGRFKSVATEDLIPMLVTSGAEPVWSEYVRKRYGAMAQPFRKHTMNMNETYELFGHKGYPIRTFNDWEKHGGVAPSGETTS
jgi:hypothetical protein